MKLVMLPHPLIGMGGPLSRFDAANPALPEYLAFFGGVGLVIVASVIVILLYRARKQRSSASHKHSHRRRRSRHRVANAARSEDAGSGSLSRERESRSRYPTLAETGGLPPVRADSLRQTPPQIQPE